MKSAILAATLLPESAVRSSNRLPSCAAIALAVALPGCAVISVVDTTVSVAASAVGLVADTAIGTVRIAGKAVGAAADAVIPDSPSAGAVTAAK